jgi:uncharacterized membrane protein YgcG
MRAERLARVTRPLAARAVLAVALFLALSPALALAAGPPFPDPVNGQAVYDTAGVLRPSTVAQVERTIADIKGRTGAEVAVYTQLVPDGVTTDGTKAHARALMDQWHVGRMGIDNGLVILFDLNQGDPCHGQVQLYAGPGYASTYLSNEERQAIYENEMLPRLRSCDRDGALLAAMAKIAANATPEHAGSLSTARQLNAVLGLIVAPLLLVLIVGWGLLRWYRVGRDPVYLDDPSILLPAPPAGLTPAAGAAVRDGGATRRALTAASLDLASRGQIAFQALPPEGRMGSKPDLRIVMSPPSPSPAEQARRRRTEARPMDDATTFLEGRLLSIAGGSGSILPHEMLELGKDVGEFNVKLERYAVAQGWYREAPGRVSSRWVVAGVLAAAAGAGALFVGWNLPSSGLLLVGASLLVSAVALFVIAVVMPARTKEGAVIKAMLEAYRRTLEKTMALSRTMGEVVQASAIPLIESPDDAVVWSVALGLQEEVEGVLARTTEDLRAGGASGAYVPLWYASSAVGHAGGAGPGMGAWAPGLMSSSPIPDFGGMMGALGTIGNAPSSSGSGGGGGFGGGGSGGGGGGAGGGF